jgi:Chalcone isomerase-like
MNDAVQEHVGRSVSKAFCAAQQLSAQPCCRMPKATENAQGKRGGFLQASIAALFFPLLVFSESASMFAKKLLILAAGFLLALPVLSAPMEVAGVKVDDLADMRGSKVPLNGAGIRYKAVFKVYVAALYVGKKAITLEEVIAQPGPKRIAVTLLRDIDSNELGKGFTKGFEENTPKAEMGKVIFSMVRMGQIFADQKHLAAGDTFMVDWLPGTGTVITVKGKVQGEPFKEVEFFNALVRIWLGPNPADWRLKEALLNKPA